MHGDKNSRNRSLLLARWRGAAVVAHERSQAPESSLTPALPDGAPMDVTGEGKVTSVSALLRQFEAEIRSSVPQPAADALGRILAPVRAAVTSELAPETCREILVRLDLIEDVLDAVLLAGRADREDTEKEREPP
jgi:hypothetical protein